MSTRDEIEAMLAARSEAMARFDADAVMQFYVKDCEVIVGELPTLTGPEAVRGFFQSMFDEGTFEPAFAIHDLRVQGNLAVLYARELLTLESKSEEVVDQFAMRHMALLTCESGKWLFVRSMVLLDGPGAVESLR